MMAETEPVKPTKLYTAKDLKEHTTEDDCWIAINNKVYDVTHFLDEHPGGFDIIVTNTGAPFLNRMKILRVVCLMSFRCTLRFIVQMLHSFTVKVVLFAHIRSYSPQLSK